MDLKKYKVTVDLDTFSFDHIDAANETDAVKQGATLVRTQYPWAKITTVHVEKIDLNRYEVFIKIEPFYYDDIQEENENDAIEYVRNLLTTKYTWANILSIKAEEIVN